jgi:hypothetical protein
VALAGASAVVSAPKGAATFNLNGSIGTFLGFLVTGNFTGIEVSRTHVPEPGSLPLFAAALAAVVVLWGARRLRA